MPQRGDSTLGKWGDLSKENGELPKEKRGFWCNHHEKSRLAIISGSLDVSCLKQMNQIKQSPYAIQQISYLMMANVTHITLRNCLGRQYHYSIGWFNGKNTGSSHISWDNLWFPVKMFP